MSPLAKNSLYCIDLKYKNLHNRFVYLLSAGYTHVLILYEFQRLLKCAQILVYGKLLCNIYNYLFMLRYQFK
jgi:hypothetical protein